MYTGGKADQMIEALGFEIWWNDEMLEFEKNGLSITVNLKNKTIHSDFYNTDARIWIAVSEKLKEIGWF